MGLGSLRLSHPNCLLCLHLQEFYIDNNPVKPSQLPAELALLPALRKLYIGSAPPQGAHSVGRATVTPQQELMRQAAAQQALAAGGSSNPAAAVAAGLLQSSIPFT
jgi:hypothetical protein